MNMSTTMSKSISSVIACLCTHTAQMCVRHCAYCLPTTLRHASITPTTLRLRLCPQSYCLPYAKLPLLPQPYACAYCLPTTLRLLPAHNPTPTPMPTILLPAHNPTQTYCETRCTTNLEISKEALHLSHRDPSTFLLNPHFVNSVAFLFELFRPDDLELCPPDSYMITHNTTCKCPPAPDTIRQTQHASHKTSQVGPQLRHFVVSYGALFAPHSAQISTTPVQKRARRSVTLECVATL